MEPTYSDLVQFRFPDAVASVDFVFTESGGVITLDRWNVTKLGAKPTLAQLDTYRDACRTWLKWKAVRALRAPLLADADINWNRANDFKNSTSREAWGTYRKALRDLPAKYAATGPDSVVWPTPPAKPTAPTPVITIGVG